MYPRSSSIDLRKLRKLLDAVDRQLSAFDVAEVEPEDKLEFAANNFRAC
jgi:hypothetical protein